MFDWDETKRTANLIKHHIDFAEAERFDWSTAKEKVDQRTAYGEDRVRALGLIDDRIHVLIYTERGERRRIISLRKANRREINEWLT